MDWSRREEPTMDVNELMQQTRDTLTVSRLFGEAYERNGTVVVPVAAVRGGGGGGHGEGGGPDGSGSGSGSGGGFGLAAKPAGVYVIDGSNVSWRPALDVNRIVLGGQIVAVVALLVLRSILRERR
jgi:uncharacterized spore protein YtfJ